jgi:hypothetical protein
VNMGRIAILLSIALFSVETMAASADTLQWEEAFDAKRAPSNVYFEACYQEGRLSHRLKVWRQGETLLRRESDGRLDLYVSNQLGNNLQFRLLDLQHKRAISVTRDNLYRIGIFSNWWSLTHVLTRPYSAFTIKAQHTKPAKTSNGKCRWCDLQSTKHTHVCWSRTWGIPLLIRDDVAGDGATPQFEIVSVRTFYRRRNCFAYRIEISSA